MTYQEKLKDPRWQKKRLEIMQRDDFKCVRCCSDVDTLTVHHKMYEKGKEPWEIKDKDLVTFCESCHSIFHVQEIQLNDISINGTYVANGVNATDLFIFNYKIGIFLQDNSIYDVIKFMKDGAK